MIIQDVSVTCVSVLSASLVQNMDRLVFIGP